MRLTSLGERRFKCQQSGHCCCDPNIIVTLTFRDIFRLFGVLENNFRALLQKISFYSLDESKVYVLQKQMVLNAIHTSQGTVIPGLRKLKGEKKHSCVFFHHPNCMVYSDRPLSCRNYPIAFLKEDNQINCTWVKNSVKTCPGIGKGSALSIKSIESQGKQFFDEIDTHNKVVYELNVEASQGRPLTAREALWVLVTFGQNEQNRKL